MIHSSQSVLIAELYLVIKEDTGAVGKCKYFFLLFIFVFV